MLDHTRKQIAHRLHTLADKIERGQVIVFSFDRSVEAAVRSESAYTWECDRHSWAIDFELTPSNDPDALVL